jgi:hypothetical protein
LKVVGGLDPNAMQMVVRQLVRDMMQTEIVPMLRQHVGEEAGLQSQLTAAQQPPVQPGANGANGAGNGAGNGSAQQQAA